MVGGVSGGVEGSCIGESGWRVVFLICVGVSLVGLWACGWYRRVVRIRTCLYSYTVTHFGCAVCTSGFPVDLTLIYCGGSWFHLVGSVCGRVSGSRSAVLVLLEVSWGVSYTFFSCRAWLVS